MNDKICIEVGITPTQARRNKYINSQADLRLSIGELILDGHFLFVEDFISSDARLAYLYARDVKKGRFEAGEKVLAKCEQWGPLYKALMIDQTD